MTNRRTFIRQSALATDGARLYRDLRRFTNSEAVNRLITGIILLPGAYQKSANTHSINETD